MIRTSHFLFSHARIHTHTHSHSHSHTLTTHPLITPHSSPPRSHITPWQHTQQHHYPMKQHPAVTPVSILSIQHEVPPSPPPLLLLLACCSLSVCGECLGVGGGGGGCAWVYVCTWVCCAWVCGCLRVGVGVYMGAYMSAWVERTWKKTCATKSTRAYACAIIHPPKPTHHPPTSHL